MPLSTAAIAQALAFTLSDNLLAPDNTHLLATVGGALSVPLVPVIGIGLGLYGCYSAIKESKNAPPSVTNRCHLLVMNCVPNLDLCLPSNAAYVRVVDHGDQIGTDQGRLFYINKLTKECIELENEKPVSFSTFDEFITKQCQYEITYDQLNCIAKMGHLHLRNYDPDDPLQLSTLYSWHSLAKIMALIATNSFAFHLFLAGVSTSVWLPISAVGFATNSSIELLRSFLLLCDFNLHETHEMGVMRVGKRKELRGKLVIHLFETMAAALVVMTGVSHLPLVLCCLGAALSVRLLMLQLSPDNHQESADNTTPSRVPINVPVPGFS